jgi:IclR family transcriptional regulator, KDG regulon repressor
MSKVLFKSLDILELCAKENEGLRLSELARLSGLNITTAYRIIAALVKRGYLRKSESNGKYLLDMKFLDIRGCLSFISLLKQIARPFVIQLSEQASETVTMINWDGRRGEHIVVIPSQHFLRVSTAEGSLFRGPLYSSSLGKVILANLTEEEIDNYYHSCLPIRQFTPNTITDLSDLKQHLIVVRREGFAFNDEEQHLGIRAIAAAVKNHDSRVVGAVNVIGPIFRFSRTAMRDIAPSVKNCASEISRSLGYTGA